MPPQDTNPHIPTPPVVPQMPPVKRNAGPIAIIIIIIILIIAGIVYAMMHGSQPAASSTSTAPTASSSVVSMAGSLSPSLTSSGITKYTGTGDTFFSFEYPTSFKLTQYPSGVSLIADANDPLAAGLASDATREFDVYIGGDTEKQIRASSINASTTKVMDAPTDGLVTYDLVQPHVVYHVIELYYDQGHDLDLVALGSYDTVASSPAAWMNAYKALVASITIDKDKLNQFIADAKARGAAAEAAAAANASSTSTTSAGIKVN